MSIRIPPIVRTQEAVDTPFDNSTNGFTATDVQAAIEEAAGGGTTSTPTFTWGRSGNVPSGTWLQNETVPSNTTGRTIGLIGTLIERIFVSNEVPNTFNLEVYEHDGVTYTLLKTVSVVALRSTYFDMLPPVACTIGKEMAVKLSSGSAKNLVVIVVMKGNT